MSEHWTNGEHATRQEVGLGVVNARYLGTGDADLCRIVAIRVTFKVKLHDTVVARYCYRCCCCCCCYCYEGLWV
jgi:hypothetical protein